MLDTQGKLLEMGYNYDPIKDEYSNHKDIFGNCTLVFKIEDFRITEIIGAIPPTNKKLIRQYLDIDKQDQDTPDIVEIEPVEGKKTLNILKDLNQSKKFVPLSVEFFAKHKILTEFKIKLIKHPATRKVYVAAKRTGKNLVVASDMAIFHENNPLGHSLATRKHKDLASGKLSAYLNRVYKILEMKGYKRRYPIHTSRNKTYFEKTTSVKKYKQENSYQLYGSLENPSATDGEGPANLGFFGRVNHDEPIIIDDMLNADKIPSEDEWLSIEEHFKDNLERFNKPFLEFFPNADPEKIKTVTWYTMNDYGKHPLSNELHRNFPQDDFVRWITGYHMDELLGNEELVNELMQFDKESGQTFLDSKWAKMWLGRPSKAVYNEDNDTLYIRSTKFENPDESSDQKTAEYNLKKIASGFIFKNFVFLTRYAGLQFQAKIKNDMLSYNIDDFNNSTLEDLIKEGYQAERISFGLDIDTSRVFTIVPAYKMVKHTKGLNGTFKKDELIFLDRMIELPAIGTGAYGEGNEMSAQQIAKHIKKYLIKNQEHLEYVNTSILVVDDNRKHYIALLKPKLSGFCNQFIQAVKHGDYDIIHRQDYMENAFKQKMLYNHIKNKGFEEDIETTIKADINSPKRKTAGSTNYLDRIDAAEYAMYPMMSILLKATMKTKKEGK